MAESKHSPEEWQKLKAEWAHDYGLRRLEDRGVRYEDSQDAQAVDRLVADFAARVEGLQRDGVPSFPPLGGRTPWVEATEAKKLERIVWESTNVWLGEKSFAPGATGPEVIAVPGHTALEAVERHIDVAGLPAAQREMLAELRAGLDAGEAR
jgi:hypothetical protein